jgi:prepilin peptidase CpaA
LFGGALTILLLLLRGFPLPSWLQDQEWAKRLHDKKSRIPYGVALAAGALFIYPETIWMKAVSM